jgi:MoaA/NifB/PqqE/SkfB family radical SAM enzyme
MVLGNLTEIDYGRSLILNYYNEPLADRAILDRIREARAAAPKARIMMYSNGDYLEPGLVDELADAGLNYLHISIHLKRNETYSDLYVINRMTEISVRMGIAAKLRRIKSGEFARAIVPHKAMEIEIRGINFHKHGTNRGGLIEDITYTEKRSAPCRFPFAHFLVSYNGLVAPCCHIRADRPEHSDYTYGSLREYGSIFEAFMSRRAAAWRREMVHDKEKRSPCDTCAGGIVRKPDELAKFALAHQRYILDREAAGAS